MVKLVGMVISGAIALIDNPLQGSIIKRNPLFLSIES
jgi:hypothetical protein